MSSVKKDSIGGVPVLAKVSSPRSVCNGRGLPVYKSIVDEPQEFDVLCGRGRGFYEHPGNLRMLTIVAGLKTSYQKESKDGKKRIALCAFDSIMNPSDGTTSRFLRRAPDNRWYELEDMEVFKKIHHTLRERKKIVKVLSNAQYSFPEEDEDDNETVSSSTSASLECFLQSLDPHHESPWNNNVVVAFAKSSDSEVVHMVDDFLVKEASEFLNEEDNTFHKPYTNTSSIMEEDDGPINFRNHDPTWWWTTSKADLLDSMIMEATPV